MHIAAAFKKPVISLWGNTVPSFGMYPYYGASPQPSPKEKAFEHSEMFDILQVNKLKCRPCSKIGYNKCPKKHFKCMENIEVTEVLEAIHSRL
jgi:ADP-heptose:LPS heptosyltransferase